MSGHSKFANIKHKKERTDAKKGKVFTKLGARDRRRCKGGGIRPIRQRQVARCHRKVQEQ